MMNPLAEEEPDTPLSDGSLLRDVPEPPAETRRRLCGESVRLRRVVTPWSAPPDPNFPRAHLWSFNLHPGVLLFRRMQNHMHRHCYLFDGRGNEVAQYMQGLFAAFHFAKDRTLQFGCQVSSGFSMSKDFH